MLLTTGIRLNELRQYQIEGAHWLAKKQYAILGDDMGVGKTPQAILACDLVGARRVVVLCPAIGVINWQREFERWSLTSPELLVISYDKLVANKRTRDAVRKFCPDTLILDEAHYLKSLEAKRTKRVYGQFAHNTGIARIPKRVWMLTGTLTPNHVGEVWTHLRCFWPELIDEISYSEFLDRYTVQAMTPFGSKVIGNKDVSEIRTILQKIRLRRRAEDVLSELPPLVWQDTTLIQPTKAMPALDELQEHEDIQELWRVLEAADELATRALLTAEEPIALATIRRLTAIIKAPLVGAQLAEELTNNAYDKVVVFVYHREALRLVAEALAPFQVVVVEGGQRDDVRQACIDRFQRDDACRCCVVQLQAGYHTITLNAAAQVVFVEQAWTPSINVQAAKRAHRFGQTRPVFVRNFGLAGSIDAAVAQVLSRKTKAILELSE